MHMTLEMICEKHKDAIKQEFGLVPEQAEVLFRYVWEKMTNGPNGQTLQKMIGNLEHLYRI